MSLGMPVRQVMPSEMLREVPTINEAKTKGQMGNLDDFELPSDFKPSCFEIGDKSYGNTGGNCMVVTVQLYLPDLDKKVWINCNDESVSITTADFKNATVNFQSNLASYRIGVGGTILRLFVKINPFENNDC